MSKKDYRQGMADAMEAYEAFGEKQEEAIRHVGNQVRKTAVKVDELGEKIGGIADYITDQEKAALYKLNTPVDIADLENAEKRILLAILYQLSADEEELTAEQQNYVHAVQQYLKIYNPQTEIDLEAVENIEDISTQKAVLQSVLEFFYLGVHPKTYTEDQIDFLDCFQVNRKTRKEIIGHIEAIINAVGVQGLAEKYGLVAEHPRSSFATYVDNGPIPEMVADLCVSIRGKGRFQNNLYFLETKDYLVFCKGECLHWEEYEKEGTIQKYGLFCIEKHSGKINHIDINYPKVFSFEWSYWLNYCIVNNTIYFIENANSYKQETVPIIAVDFASKTYRILPLKIPTRTNGILNRFHITGDSNYLMIHAYPTASRYYDKKVNGVNKTYVVDLTQNDRVFMLEPDLAVRDAFLWDGRFLFLASTKEKNSYTSLFRYDPTKKTTEDILSEYQGVLDTMNVFSFGRDWTHNFSRNYIIEQIQCVKDKWYILYREEDESSDSSLACKRAGRILAHPGVSADTKRYFLKEIETNPIDHYWYKDALILMDASAVCWRRWNDESTYQLVRYDFDAESKTYPDKGADDYILLGDYLYKRCDKEWYRTNTSAGWDNLQWEMVALPEAPCD